MARFQDHSERLVAFDSGYVTILAGMLNAESTTLRAESYKHEAHAQRLQAAEAALSSRPWTSSFGSRLRVPDPSGWKLDVLKGREDGFSPWRESFDLQAGSIWAGIEKVLEQLCE